MALGMITVFVNVMTKESMIAVMNQKISQVILILPET